MIKEMRNTRGFIFTIDAIMALVIIMILAGGLVVHYQNMESQPGVYQKSFENSRDDAMVNFYMGSDAQENFGVNLSSCYTYYTYNPDNGSGQATADEKKVCR